MPTWITDLGTRGAAIVVSYIATFLASKYQIAIDSSTQSHLIISLVTIFTTVYAIVHSSGRAVVAAKTGN